MDTALGIVRPGGAIGRVGVPHYGPIDLSTAPFYHKVIVAGGPAPVRAYMDELLPDVMEGRIEPGRVFDRTISLDEVPDGYRAMNEREALKVMVRPKGMFWKSCTTFPVGRCSEPTVRVACVMSALEKLSPNSGLQAVLKRTATTLKSL